MSTPRAQKGTIKKEPTTSALLIFNYYSTTSKASLWGPQTGHTQSSGRSSQAVPGRMPFSGSPRAGADVFRVYYYFRVLRYEFSKFSKFSKATRTASITKAENVQFCPLMAFSTCSITSLGKRIHLLVVGGIEGILKFFI